jgi:DNA-binding transcriptional MerR regulator
MSKQTQISLDFGQEQSSPPSPSTGDGAAGDPTQPYMAAEGVGVRLKSYKRTAESPPQDSPDPLLNRDLNGDVFGGTEEMAPPTPAADPLPRRLTAATRKAAPAPKKAPSKRGRKSLKQVGAEADLIEIPEDEVLFSKQYYTMGEVSEMFRVNQSLLRFWETEFDILQPRKNKKGDRYFRPADIKNLHLIYHLLRQKKYTIEGAKEFLKKNKTAEDRFEVIQHLLQIKAFLLEWKAQL